MRFASRYVFLAIALCPMLPAIAADTLRVDSRVLVFGDTATHAVELLGEPAYREPINNEFGAWLGERWQFSRDGHVITVTILGGKVAAIEDRAS